MEENLSESIVSDSGKGVSERERERGERERERGTRGEVVMMDGGDEG